MTCDYGRVHSARGGTGSKLVSWRRTARPCCRPRLQAHLGAHPRNGTEKSLVGFSCEVRSDLPRGRIVLHCTKSKAKVRVIVGIGAILNRHFQLFAFYLRADTLSCLDSGARRAGAADSTRKFRCRHVNSEAVFRQVHRLSSWMFPNAYLGCDALRRTRSGSNLSYAASTTVGALGGLVFAERLISSLGG